ncbi:MAG: M48 family metalloprotease [Candidatus Riflebacteria bacterium]|nr:M48 family metalloprotease [Candidatus Riflebacteria bacterium]
MENRFVVFSRRNVRDVIMQSQLIMNKTSFFSTSVFWRYVLIAIFPVIFGGICLVSFHPAPPPDGFPGAGDFLTMLRYRQPALFFQELERRIGAARSSPGAVRALWDRLNDVIRQGDASDRASAESVCGALLVRLGYLERGRVELERAASGTTDEDERTASLLLMLDADRRLGDRIAAASAAEQLREIDGAAADLDMAVPELDIEPGLAQFIGLASEPASAGVTGASTVESRSPLVIIPLWLILLMLPFIVIDMERRRWMKTWPAGAGDRSRPFMAFRRSPLAFLLAVGSALIVFVFRFPMAGFEGPMFAVIHLVVAFTLALIPHFRLDCHVRGASWTFFAFLSHSIRLSLLSSAHLLMLLPVVVILRKMALVMPMWPLLSPIGPALAIPSLTATFFLLLSPFWPLFLGLSAFRSEQAPDWVKQPPFPPTPVYLWNKQDSLLALTISFGSLSSSHGIAISDYLLKSFSPEEAAAAAGHEVAHLRLQHRFLAFVAFFDALLLIGLFVAMHPLVLQRFLLLGPTPVQPVILFIVYLVFAHLMTRLNHIMEVEADRFTVEHFGRDVTISSISRIEAAQRLPERRRDGEEGGIHSSPVERKRLILSEEGEFIEPCMSPDAALLIALWRSRLALDWKIGEAETVHLCALEFEVPAGCSSFEQMRAMGRHHAAFGSESLVNKDGRGIEMLFCAQKAAVRQADPPLPLEKVCQLCSRAFQSCLASKTQWNESSRGCRLIIRDE